MKQHIRKSLALPALVGLLTVAGVAAGCATSGVNRGDLNLVSLQEEWQMGQQLEAQIAQQLQLVNDAQALSYLNNMGRALVSQTELANVPWEFHIVADPAINAFNIPGGHVYVNTGLVAAADNASELAGVLSHEISHGVSRHGTERISKAYGLNIAAGVALGGNPGLIQQIAAQIIGGGAIAKFSRDDEREADRLGVRYMHGAGYDPNGMASMFEELLGERRSSPSRVSQFFSTHPLTEERISNVRAQAQQLGRSGVRTNDGGFASFKSRLARYNPGRTTTRR